MKPLRVSTKTSYKPFLFISLYDCAIINGDQWWVFRKNILKKIHKYYTEGYGICIIENELEINNGTQNVISYRNVLFDIKDHIINFVGNFENKTPVINLQIKIGLFEDHKYFKPNCKWIKEEIQNLDLTNSVVVGIKDTHEMTFTEKELLDFFKDVNPDSDTDFTDKLENEIKRYREFDVNTKEEFTFRGYSVKCNGFTNNKLSFTVCALSDIDLRFAINSDIATYYNVYDFIKNKENNLIKLEDEIIYI